MLTPIKLGWGVDGDCVVLRLTELFLGFMASVLQCNRPEDQKQTSPAPSLPIGR